MKKVSFADIKKTGRWVLPVGIVALGFASAVAMQPGTGGPKAAVVEDSSTSSEAQMSESSASAVKPKIMVNGAQISTDTEGSTDVDIPGGKAKVEVSDGHTRITTSDKATSGDTSNNTSGNVDVKIDSQSSSGTSWGSTQVYGYNSSSDGSETSFHSTSIFSTDSDNVSVSSQQ